MKIKVDGCTAYIQIYCDYLGRYYQVGEDDQVEYAFWVRHDSWCRYLDAQIIVSHKTREFEADYQQEYPPCNKSPTL